MPRHLFRQAALPLAMLLIGVVGVSAQDKKDNPAAKPAPRDEGWKKRHEGFLEIVKKGDVDVLFLGDSITDGWRGKNGSGIWKKEFEPLKAANFGIGGDQTQHVLWRIQNGEMDGIKPKVAVLMIGTNNLGGHSNEQIAGGIKAIVEEIHKKSPETKVLLLGIFPRDAKSDDKRRVRIKEINEVIAKLDDGKKVKYLDFGKKFLKDDGELTKEVMPDLLHLSPKGYEIWAENVREPLKDLLK